MKVFLTLVAIALGALVMWFGFFYEEPQPQSRVVVIANAWHTASAAQSFQRMEAVARASEVVRVASPATPSTDRGKCEEYKGRKAYLSFMERRNEMIGKYWREVNDPRVKQGLEPFPDPEVVPTPEERAAMLVEFGAALREIDKKFEEGCHNQSGMNPIVIDLLGHLQNAGISAADLDEEAYRLAMKLGRAEADFHAKYVQTLLNRGCHGTALYVMDTVINQIADRLEHPASMGYIFLYSQIANIREAERHSAEAGTEEATEAAVENLRRQRASICGSFG